MQQRRFDGLQGFVKRRAYHPATQAARSRYRIPVVKNTLARFAAEKAGKSFLAGSLEGPVAIAFGYDEVLEPAKTLAAYIRASETALSIKGGFMGDRLLSQDDIKTLASIPSRDALIAQVLGGMQAPIAGVINCLAGPLRGFGGILQARIKQLEEN